jgi:hypothetical protein
MVLRRLIVPAGRGLFALALVFGAAGCGSTFDRVDSSADKAVARVELAADRALDAAASRASALVTQAVAQAEAASGRLLDRASTTLVGAVEKIPATLAAGLKAQTDAAASRTADKAASLLPPADREAFRRDVSSYGVLEALKQWWLEIVLSFFGAGGVFKGLLASRRARRDAKLAQAAVESIEEAGDERIKNKVAAKTKGLAATLRDEINARVQEIVAKAKSGQ